jgi:hypothetical protein
MYDWFSQLQACYVITTDFQISELQSHNYKNELIFTIMAVAHTNRYAIPYPKFWKPRSSENRKFFHGGRLQPKYDGHHDNDDDIDVPSSPGSSSKV